MKKVFLIIFLFLGAIVSTLANRYDIIPYPNSLVKQSGNFQFKKELKVSIPSKFKSEYTTLAQIFKDEHSITLIKSKKADVLVKENNSIKEEGYKMKISSTGITIEASNKSGVFYAFQSLRQLLTPTTKGGYTLAACEIEDAPKLSWRAYMLDEGRNFQGKKVVKQLLDEMAYMKMNVFHWHLTEDQGWRVEIKKYPLLTEIGAFRDSTVRRETVITNNRGRWKDNQPYSPLPTGGYYTQDDVKEIVAYAAKLHINVMPEIEMPGHASAAIAAYPWLMDEDAEETKVPVNYGIKHIAYNVASDKVYTFLTDVLTEVIDLFPFEVIHIGGDEVRYDSWKKNNDIQNLMTKKNLKTYADVQIDFTNRISNFVENKGRRMMGWNEILGNVHVDAGAESATTTLAKSSVIHFWKGDTQKLVQALKNGYEVVNSWNQFTYLDYVGENTPIEKMYGYNPIPKGLTQDESKRLIGVGYQMWGEVTTRPIDVYSFTFPRLAAGAEVAWTNEDAKDISRFKQSLARIKLYWDRKGLYYCEE